MIFPFTAVAPRLFTDETCEPAMLTRAEVISSPEVDSAFLTDCMIACEAADRSTMTPLRIPSAGSMPTPRIRMELLSSTRPTSVHTLVVPTSMPTAISSILLAHHVIRCSGQRHVNHGGRHACLCERSDHRFIDLDL